MSTVSEQRGARPSDDAARAPQAWNQPLNLAMAALIWLAIGGLFFRWFL